MGWPSAGCHTRGTERLSASTLPSSRTSVPFSGIIHVYILIRIIAFFLPLPFLSPKEKKSILRETTRTKAAEMFKPPTSPVCCGAQASGRRCEDPWGSQCGDDHHKQGGSLGRAGCSFCSPWLAPSPLWPGQTHSPHCGRRTHSSSSHRTSHLAGGWRTRCRSFARSCCPLPRPAPRPPHRAGAAGRPGHCVQTCAPCTLGPCWEC